MKSSTRLAAAVIIAASAVAAIPLLAQPEYPYSPTGKDKEKTLTVTPGLYNSFVFACDGTRGSTALKSPTGELTVVVSVGDTVIVPMPPSWSLAQQGTLTVKENAGATLIVSAVTSAGPVGLEAAKK